MTSQGNQPGGWIDLLVPFVFIFFVMWLFVFRPHRREQKMRQEMLDTLKIGDDIITTAGILGKVSKIKGDQVQIKVDESSNAKITFLRSAIMTVKRSKEDEAK